MFEEATKFNGDVSDWDVSSVTDMSVSFHFRKTFMFNIVYFSINTYIYSFISLPSRKCFMEQQNLMATFLIGMYLP